MRSVLSRLSLSSLGLFLCVITLMVLGLLMVYNTTSAEALDLGKIDKINHSFIKQILFAAFGATTAFLFFRWGTGKFYTYVGIIFVLWVFLLFIILIPRIGMELNGARRWIKIFGISFQPSEFAKIILPIYFIKKFLEQPFEIKNFFRLLSILALPLFLILVEPDNGTAVIIGACLMTLFFLLRIPMKYWLLPFCLLVIIGGSYAVKRPHVKARIHIYLHPEDDLLGKGHQPFQAKIAAGSGGMTGRGLGNSLQKLNYLPEARSDYIAAIYAEEFGFMGILGLIVLYLLVVTFGFQIALKALNEHTYLIAATMTFLIGFQAFLNLGVVSGLLPSKGTNLPFFSQGGSSLCANLMIIAILMNIDYSSSKNVESAYLCRRLS